MECLFLVVGGLGAEGEGEDDKERARRSVSIGESDSPTSGKFSHSEDIGKGDSFGIAGSEPALFRELETIFFKTALHRRQIKSPKDNKGRLVSGMFDSGAAFEKILNTLRAL